jgi:hypothetical protein
MNVCGLSGAHEARHADAEYSIGMVDPGLPPGVPG